MAGSLVGRLHRASACRARSGKSSPSAAASPINPRALLRKNQALIGFYRGAGAIDNLFVEERAQLYRDLEAMLAKGELTAPIGKTYYKVGNDHFVKAYSRILIRRRNDSR